MKDAARVRAARLLLVVAEGTRSAVALSRRRKRGARSEEMGLGGKKGVVKRVRLAGEGVVVVVVGLQARGRARSVMR